MRLSLVLLLVVLFLGTLVEARGGMHNVANMNYEYGLTITTTKKIPKKDCPRKAKKNDMVYVEYTGYLADGTIFDSSSGKKPFRFVLGTRQVIAGWDKGILGMCIGEQRKLTIPPSLAYGKTGAGPIPPDATLTFEVELTSIAGFNANTEQHNEL
ncbi:uncharacterized protein V1518DRAFT_449744 [Limtongia smithiae]|uniref:uncharacterized protein n=1 Tax=Limtongia smithiae TaxID=1125753 RepID=UPI0034CF33CB